MKLDGAMFDFEKYPDEARVAIGRYGKETVDEMHAWVQSYSPRDTGKLMNAHRNSSHLMSDKPKNGKTQGSVWIDERVAPYWQYVYDATKYGKTIKTGKNPSATEKWFEIAYDKHYDEWMENYSDNVRKYLKSGYVRNRTIIHKQVKT